VALQTGDLSQSLLRTLLEILVQPRARQSFDPPLNQLTMLPETSSQLQHELTDNLWQKCEAAC